VGLGDSSSPDQVPVSARLFADTVTGVVRLNVPVDTIVGGMPRQGEVGASWKQGPRLPADPAERGRCSIAIDCNDATWKT
jgi:hypothetical protein